MTDDVKAGQLRHYVSANRHLEWFVLVIEKTTFDRWVCQVLLCNDESKCGLMLAWYTDQLRHWTLINDVDD